MAEKKGRKNFSSFHCDKENIFIALIANNEG